MSETLDGKPRRDVDFPSNLNVSGDPICPGCGCNASTVLNTYPWKDGIRRRRRQCDHCLEPFFTKQKAEECEDDMHKPCH